LIERSRDPRRIDLEDPEFLSVLPEVPLQGPLVATSIMLAPAERDASGKRGIVLGLNNSVGGLNSKFAGLDHEGILAEDFRGHLDELQSALDSDIRGLDCFQMYYTIVDTVLWHLSTAKHCVELPTRTTRPNQERLLAKDLWVTVDSNQRLTLQHRDSQGGRRTIWPSYVSILRHTRENLPHTILRTIGSQLGPTLSFWIPPHFRGGLHQPRISVGSVIVSRETWAQAGGEIKAGAGAASKGETEATEADVGLWNTFLAINLWRLGREMPRNVYWGPTLDEALWIDFGNPLSLDAFRISAEEKPQDLFTFLEAPELDAASTGEEVCTAFTGLGYVRTSKF
jgi:hypothetical protein